LNWTMDPRRGNLTTILEKGANRYAEDVSERPCHVANLDGSPLEARL
jgi:hypothetical protein